MPLLTRTEYVTVFPAAFQAVRKASSPRALGIPTAKGAPQAMELPRDAHGTARLPAINACPGGNAGYSPNDRKWHRRCDSSQGPWGQDTAGLARGHSGAVPGSSPELPPAGTRRSSRRRRRLPGSGSPSKARLLRGPAGIAPAGRRFRLSPSTQRRARLAMALIHLEGNGPKPPTHGICVTAE